MDWNILAINENALGESLDALLGEYFNTWWSENRAYFNVAT